MMLRAGVFTKNSAGKFFYWSAHWTSLDVSNKLTYSFYLSIRHYNSSDIKFCTGITKKLSKQWTDIFSEIGTETKKFYKIVVHFNYFKNNN